MANKKLYIPEIITKEIEIQILGALFDNGDTYFYDYFSEDDINTMCSNIKNDFPLLMNTSIDKKYEQTKKNATQMAKELDEKNAQLATRANTISDLDAIAQSNRKKVKALALAILREEADATEVYEVLSHAEIIRMKLEYKLELTDHDNMYLRGILPQSE